MRVWRFDRDGRNPLDGLGGLHSAGRWHPRGSRVVYTSGHLSLAVLERLVHLDPDLLPDNLVAFEIEISDEPSSMERVPLAGLPPDWKSQPPASSTQEIGRAWLTDPARPGVLVVPSAIVTSESNYLLNPAHRGSRRWSVVSSEPFRFDARL
ncbi:MAG: RES family NAD+ phosphorylase [Gemmatimonadales bacterium]